MSRKPQKPLPIHERIRNRRERLGMSAKALATRAGFSPSYLSLIEQGQKIPSEKLAVRIAEVLHDDPELYRAWARASRMGDDLPDSIEMLQRARLLRSDPDARRRIGSGESMHRVLGDYDEADDDELLAPRVSPRAPMSSASRRRAWLRRFSKSSSVEDDVRIEVGSFSASSMLHGDASRTRRVPLLRSDPDGDDSPAFAETLEIDRAMLPPDASGAFAYRVDSSSIRRVEWSLKPGDLAIFVPPRDDEPLDPEGIYAVHSGSRILLSRVALYDDVLLLTGSDVSPHPINRDTGTPWRELLAGKLVASVRRWGESAEADDDRPTRLGRSVRRRGNVIERDCEWKDGYGWRPLQRAEDMDYLDEHPGTKIRYRLLRDGEPRFVLEMTADEWRDALGDYFEGDTWRKNGYIVAVTKRRGGTYTEEFQDRWAPYVRKGDVY